MTTVEEKKLRDELLISAKQHYFSMGLNDGTSNLCKVNMIYGIAKIHYMQLENGMEPDGMFISTPDETISRNVVRWNNGFGYGGKLSWGRGKEKLVVLDVKPNYCGILAGGIDEIPNPEDLISKINDFLLQDLYIDDFRLISDFHKSNHFIDLFEIKSVGEAEVPSEFPKFMFLIHGSCPELRTENNRGPGLYYDKSPALMSMANKLETPHGVIHFLLDSDAREYLDYCEYADKFSKEKRRMIGKYLFDDFKEISNPTHQGLLGYNSILLGAQSTSLKENPENIFPIALKADLPSYLFAGKTNLTREHIEELGFLNRAEKLGVLDDLLNVNIIPHGGGYKFNDIISVLKVFNVANRRFFVCEMENDVGLKIIEDVSALQFSYRGKNVIKKTVDLELGIPLVKLVPIYVLKI
ncbi:MAG: hypothetical protein ACTSVI_13725 [Promethearchaeota archaeon]